MSKYRLITRSDFDGLVCAALFKELDMIDDILFVNPKTMQDGKIAVSGHDITANLPYAPGVYMAFDHHESEASRVGEKPNYVIDPTAPSAARVVYEYYGGKEKFKNISDELMRAVDKADAAHFTPTEVLYPKDWELLNFILDPRTGLDRFSELKLSSEQLMIRLVDCCLNDSIESILDMPEVQERIEFYFRSEDKFKDQIRRRSKLYDTLVVLDLRGEEIIYAGNRFLIYALFPTCNISMQVYYGRDRKTTVFALGKSIFNRTCHVVIGDLMLYYGGGGHASAGTCEVDNDSAEQVMKEIIAKINSEG